MIWSNILIYFVIVPLLMLGGLALSKSVKQVRAVAVTGATALMVLAAYLVIEFLSLRADGDASPMLFTDSWTWFAPLNINLALGVDGISVVMIVLSAFIVFAGVFASWNLKPLTKEYFMWF